MDLIVKQASALTTEEKTAMGITGIPDAWPIESYPYSGSVPSGFTQMTDVEMEALKANNQAAYDAWVASKQPIIQLPPVAPTDTDGSPLAKLKLAPLGWTIQDHYIEFSTSLLESIYSKKSDGSDFGFSTLKFYEGAVGSETLIVGGDQNYLDGHCTMTVIDVEPTHDYDVIEGETSALGTYTNDVRVWGIAVPDIPYAYGGSKELITGGCNLRYQPTIAVDGKVAKHLVYNSIYHTNKVRLMVRHDAGVKAKISICLDFYKA